MIHWTEATAEEIESHANGKRAKAIGMMGAWKFYSLDDDTIIVYWVEEKALYRELDVGPVGSIPMRTQYYIGYRFDGPAYTGCPRIPGLYWFEYDPGSRKIPELATVYRSTCGDWCYQVAAGIELSVDRQAMGPGSDRRFWGPLPEPNVPDDLHGA